MMSAGKTREDIMVSLRRQRSFTSASGPLVWFESLVVQSGIGAGVMRVVVVMLMLGGGGLVLTWLARNDILSGVVGGVVAGLLLPLLFLILKQRARLRRF